MNVAIDMGGLDGLSPNQGQYRYVMDLVSGLSKISSPLKFVVIGVLATPAPKVHESLRQSNWRYVHFPRLAGKGSFYINQARLSYLLFKENIDVCHCLHSFVPLVSPCRIVVTLYDLMYDIFPDYRQASESRPYKLYRWAVRHRARQVICISQTTAKDASSLWKVDPSKLKVVYLGTDLKCFNNSRHSTPIPIPFKGGADGSADFPTICSPYNLEPRKNLQALLKVLAKLKVKYPAVRLVLFGKAGITPERETDFREQVEHFTLKKHIVFTGFLSDVQLAELLRRSTLFVFPSLYEGFGLPVLEAMASGTCVVVHNASAMAEIVGDAGIVTDTQNIPAFLAAVEGVLQDSAMRLRLAKAGRERAQRFNIRTMAEQTHAIYDLAVR